MGRWNEDPFKEDFMFELTKSEMKNFVSQNVIPDIRVLRGAKPFAFTEQGVVMLSSVLPSKKSHFSKHSQQTSIIFFRYTE